MHDDLPSTIGLLLALYWLGCIWLIFLIRKKMIKLLMLVAFVLGVSAVYISVKIEVMKATKQDIDRGYKQCDDCEKLHIFNAGTDYDADEWVKCLRCDCWVVDQKIINDGNEV